MRKAACAPGARGGQKRALDPQNLVLWTYPNGYIEDEKGCLYVERVKYKRK